MMANDMASETLSTRIADFILQLRWSDVPEPTLRSAKLRFLDILGVSLAASGTRGARAVGYLVRGRGGHREATLFGTAQRVPAASAAMANGFLAHALDFDDTHHESRIHPSCVIIPATLAAAEANGTGGREALLAAVAGFEVCVRIGLAAPGLFHERGWHATSACGTLAAAGLAGRLFGLGTQALVQAIGVSASMASGIREAYLGEGTDTKALHPGWAAQSGITAAELAAMGFTGASSALEGRFGYFHAFLAPTPWNLLAQLDTLGSVWHTPDVTYKLFPCGSLAHGCIDAALELYRDRGIRGSDVSEIVCIVPAGMVSTICEPAATKMDPRSGYEAKFSVQYAVAAALCRGRVTEDEFGEDALQDPGIRDTLSRVCYEVDPSLPFPSKYPGGVRVTLSDGSTQEVRRANSPGTLERPLDDIEIVEKFLGNVPRRIPEGRAREVAERVLALEEEETLTPLLSLLDLGAGGQP
jgi:2-methylcitrate dehydratase PrpD